MKDTNEIGNRILGNWKHFACGVHDDHTCFTAAYNTNEERDAVADRVHASLVGLDAYINSDIVVNIDEDCKMFVGVDNAVCIFPDWLGGIIYAIRTFHKSCKGSE